MQSLYNDIIEVQRGNSEQMLRLIEQFRPLIAKHARKLGYEDAFEDVQVKFIEVIQGIKMDQLQNAGDPYILKYLKRSIENYFITLLQKQKANDTIPLSSLCEDDKESFSFLLDRLFTCSDEYPQMEYDVLRSILTPYECEIIRYFYFECYSVKEIAAHYRVSMPAISQAKANALKKLRKYFEKEMKQHG